MLRSASILNGQEGAARDRAASFPLKRTIPLADVDLAGTGLVRRLIGAEQHQATPMKRTRPSQKVVNVVWKLLLLSAAI
jgi:hypothetical protein